MNASAAPAASPRVLFFVRARLLTAAMSLLGIALAVVLFLAFALSHRDLLFTAALAALVMSVLGNALTQSLRAWLLWREGVWRDLGGKQRTRPEQPTRFKAGLAVSLLYAGLSAGMAGYLALTLVGRL